MQLLQLVSVREMVSSAESATRHEQIDHHYTVIKLVCNTDIRVDHSFGHTTVQL